MDLLALVEQTPWDTESKKQKLVIDKDFGNLEKLSFWELVQNISTRKPHWGPNHHKRK